MISMSCLLLILNLDFSTKPSFRDKARVKNLRSVLGANFDFETEFDNLNDVSLTH